MYLVSYPNITKHRGFYWKHKQIDQGHREVLEASFLDFMHAFLHCLSRQNLQSPKSGAIDTRESMFFS